MYKNAIHLFSSLMLLSLPLAAEEINFNRDIRPLLSDRCFHCHGPDEEDRKSHLRLDKPDGPESPFIERKGVVAIHKGKPEKSELWFRISSEDPDEVMPPPDSTKKALTKDEIELFRKWIEGGAQYEDFWAFVPPAKPATPKVKNKVWRSGTIDPYVMARLDKLRLTPRPEADKRTLIRRLTFDLTGLPPTVDEVRAFVEDASPDAYEKLVDELLSRKSYGEHMARYWADLVRLADTNGMHKDFYRNFVAYRTWLINAFNENLPYDDFGTYQLAGDLLPNPTERQLVASGFNRLHLIIDRGTALPEESFHKNIIDRIEAFGTVFLGMTVQCAMCHDHKYDPLTTHDYYSLYGFFNNFDGEPETSGRPKEGLQPPFIELKDPLFAYPGNETPKAMVMKERAEPRETFLLNRGAYDDPGEKMTRATPAFLPPMTPRGDLPDRLDLARWLFQPGQPLTSRVAVNRFWQQFFGVGLVKTAEDFGAQGEWPSHPDLLDSLAVTFMESGWDIKALVKDIVMSNTYRQSSDAEPESYLNDRENRLLARGPRYRMDAEMIRDQYLVVSGLFNPAMYGPSVKPPQPPGLWEAVSMAAPFTYKADDGDKIYRRSFYSYWRRALPMPQMTLLNAPTRESCTARRERTNTPLQALLLMNEKEYFKMAQACAQNSLSEAGNKTEDALRLAYEKMTSHLPTEKRLGLMVEALEDFKQYYTEHVPLAHEMTPDMATSSDEERVTLSAWTMVVHGLMNTEMAKVKR
jgi:hypothetical protein